MNAQQQEQQHKQQRRRVPNMRTVEIFTDADVLARLFTFLSATPQQQTPFRLELSTVRNTLFLEAGRRHGQGHTHQKSASGRRVPPAIPVWAPEALRQAGASRGQSEDPRLPFSGGHYRVVRYRVGNIVCAVRSRVDFVHETRRVPPKAAPFDPLLGVRPETVVTPQEDAGDDENNNSSSHEIQTWRTAVQKKMGMGTKPDQTGKAALRFRGDSSRRAMLATELPRLWFSRTSYLVQAVVRAPRRRRRHHPEAANSNNNNLTVRSSKIHCVAGGPYRAWERAHQADLRKLAALLRKLKQITRALGGECVVVGDPSRQCFMVMEPVLHRNNGPVPEEVVSQLWGVKKADDDDDGDGDGDDAETEYESTAASESSELSSLRSQTPSGFEDWKLEDQEEKEDAGQKRRQQAVKKVFSRALVQHWLGQGQLDGVVDGVEFDIDGLSSDESTTTDDSQSQRGDVVEACEWEEEDDDDEEEGDDELKSSEEDDSDDEDYDDGGERRGVDGSFAHQHEPDVLRYHYRRITVGDSDEMEDVDENDHRHGYASDEDEASPRSGDDDDGSSSSRRARQRSGDDDSDAMDVDEGEFEYTYSFADDEEDEAENNEDGGGGGPREYWYPSVEYDVGSEEEDVDAEDAQRRDPRWYPQREWLTGLRPPRR